MIDVHWKGLLQGSWVATRLIRCRSRIQSWCTATAGRWLDYYRAARRAGIWKEEPLRAGGVVLLVSVLTSSILGGLLGRWMGSGEIGWRGALVILGFWGLGSPCRWEAVCDGFFLMRVLKRVFNRGGTA